MRKFRSKLPGFLSRRNTASHRCNHTRQKALPSCPPEHREFPLLLYHSPSVRSCNKKYGAVRTAPHDIYIIMYIPTLALSKSGTRSKGKPSSQPVCKLPSFLLSRSIIARFRQKARPIFLANALSAANIKYQYPRERQNSEGDNPSLFCLCFGRLDEKKLLSLASIRIQRKC